MVLTEEPLLSPEDLLTEVLLSDWLELLTAELPLLPVVLLAAELLLPPVAGAVEVRLFDDLEVPTASRVAPLLLLTVELPVDLLSVPVPDDDLVVVVASVLLELPGVADLSAVVADLRVPLVRFELLADLVEAYSLSPSHLDSGLE